MLRHLFIFFAVVAALGAHALVYCPPQLQRGGHLQGFGCNCFSFHPELKRQFETAEDFCREDGGHLAIIRDIETQKFLYHTMHDQLGYGGEVWIGLNDKDSEGTFVWNDGSAASFTYWASNQPGVFLGIGGSLEDCVFMNMSDQGRWHDGLCHKILFFTYDKPFICEYTAKILTIPTTTTTTTTTTTKRPTTRLLRTTTTQPPLTTTPTTTTTTTTTTRTVTLVGTKPPSTSTATPVDSGCQPFDCTKDCSATGYKLAVNGCMLCQCA